MRWSERQRAMLEAMGIRLWADPHGLQPDADGTPPTPPPGGRGGEPGGSQDDVVVQVAPVARTVPVAVAAPAATGDAGRTAVAAMDWDALRAAVVSCTACKLCSSGRRQTVFGVGNPRAHWMIVGEAPGEQEDLQGEPFVGKSGQLLDNMLRAIGLTRAQAEPAKQVFIANTLKCRPPGNRNPEADELVKCEPFLIRQIELVQPRIILAMGRFAVQSLLRSNEPIGRLRGRVHRYQGVPLIVTYHPAYLLRNLEDKAKAWDDLCLARVTAEAAEAADSA
jgi:DNA polymerase